MTRTLPIYQVDAFADRLFAGNPAAVVPLEAWLPDAVLQAVAAENNLAETAFFVPAGGARWALRWFTPTVEVPLCGHATLASAFVLTRHMGVAAGTIRFDTQRSGTLTVTRDGEVFELGMPRRQVVPGGSLEEAEAALGRRPLETFAIPVVGDDQLLAVFAHEDEVRTLAPDFAAMRAISARSVLATAPGRTVDFVSRYFAPKFGIDEDPVTGSTHTALAPFWGERLGRDRLTARQLSARGGTLDCRLGGETVFVAGRAVLYLEGRIVVDD